MYEHASRSADYSHILVCYHHLPKMFGKVQPEDENTNMLGTLNTEKQFFLSKQGTYDRGHIYTNHILDNQLPHLWHQQYYLGATHIFGKVEYRFISKIFGIGSDKKGSMSIPFMGVSVLLNLYPVVLIII